MTSKTPARIKYFFYSILCALKENSMPTGHDQLPVRTGTVCKSETTLLLQPIFKLSIITLETHMISVKYYITAIILTVNSNQTIMTAISYIPNIKQTSP